MTNQSTPILNIRLNMPDITPRFRTDRNPIPPHQMRLLQAYFSHRDQFATGRLDTNLLHTIHVDSIPPKTPIGSPIESELIDFIRVKRLYTGPPGLVGTVFLVDSQGCQEAFFFLRDEADRRALNPQGRNWNVALPADEAVFGSESDFGGY